VLELLELVWIDDVAQIAGDHVVPFYVCECDSAPDASITRAGVTSPSEERAMLNDPLEDIT
jgi:hypothetical protein